MRTLSLVDCVELKFPGSILKEALCFGDADNDGVNELVIGNSDGDLFIFKDDKCICRAFDLGCIAAIAIGDLLNIKKNVVVVTTTEGHCHVFDVEDELNNPLLDTSNQEDVFSSSTSIDSNQIQSLGCRVIQQFHTQRIVANTKAMFLADVNDDSLVEMVCGLTDRVLRTYKWIIDPVQENDIEEEEDETNGVYSGRLQAVNKWELANQIGSIAPHRQRNLVSILIGAGGGTVTRITEISKTSCKRSEMGVDHAEQCAGPSECDEVIDKEFPPGDEDHSVLRNPSPNVSENISIKHHSLNSSRMRNQNISTHVAGNIMSHDGKNEDSYAVGTWDGTVMICKDDTIEWSLQVDKPVMTVQSFSGNAIFVDWEGPTYLINRRLDPLIQNCVYRFYFEDQVAAFRVGMYGISQDGPGEKNEIINQNCFAYVTFHGSIYIYPNSFL